MKFEMIAGAAPAGESLENIYAAAEKIGRAALGGGLLFYRSGLKIRTAELSAVTRIFRRVHGAPAKLCCGRGNFDSNSVVVCGVSGELLELEMPDERHAKLLMSKLQSAAPLAGIGYKTQA